MQDLHYVLRRAVHSPWTPDLELERGPNGRTALPLHRFNQSLNTVPITLDAEQSGVMRWCIGGRFSRKHVMSELQVIISTADRD